MRRSDSGWRCVEISARRPPEAAESVPASDDVSVAESRTASGERFVRHYYSLLNRHRYSSAWALLESFGTPAAGPPSGPAGPLAAPHARHPHQSSLGDVCGRQGDGGHALPLQQPRCLLGQDRSPVLLRRRVLVRRNGYWTATSLRIRKVGGDKPRLSRAECARRPGDRVVPVGRRDVAAAEVEAPAAVRATCPAFPADRAGSSTGPTGRPLPRGLSPGRVMSAVGWTGRSLGQRARTSRESESATGV